MRQSTRLDPALVTPNLIVWRRDQAKPYPLAFSGTQLPPRDTFTKNGIKRTSMNVELTSQNDPNRTPRRFGLGAEKARVIMANKSVSVSGPVDIKSTAKQPVAAIDDLSSQRFYHGTKADLKPGDLIEPGHNSNFGKQERRQPTST